MNVQDIYIYPVKSLGGIRVDQAEALQKGFRFDRRWMLVDENGKFITQRVEHQLALLQTRIAQNGIEITHKNHPSKKIFIPFNISNFKELNVQVWDDEIQVCHIAEQFDIWFSDFLNTPCKLVYQPETNLRPVSLKYAQNNEQVSLADAFPYLLISQASFDDLNGRLDQPVPMNRFRPNIVVSNTLPFEEDSWNEIQIGNVRFKVSKPCARCVLTTVNQDNGIKGKEPLLTLSKYRTVDGKVMFGQNLLALNEGIICKDDIIKVISWK